MLPYEVALGRYASGFWVLGSVFLVFHHVQNYRRDDAQLLCSGRVFRELSPLPAPPLSGTAPHPLMKVRPACRAELHEADWYDHLGTHTATS